MPLDKHIADFLAASSGAPQPASLGDLRAATEVDLLRLQGEDKLSDEMLKGEIKRGDRLSVCFKDDELIFSHK